MGRIAELYEKQALGTLNDAESKELKKLLAEAAQVRKDAEDGDGDGAGDGKDDDGEGDDLEKAIDSMAQKMADAAQERMETAFKKMTEELKDSGNVVPVTHATGSGFIIDKALGKSDNGYKMSVYELSQIKEAVPGRENKKVKEVSARTKHFLAALMTGDKEKLQILSEGTPGDGGYLVPEEFANMIVEDIRDINIVRQLSGPPITINTDTLHLPSLTSRPQANWRSEKAIKQTSTASFGETVFTPYSLAAIVGLSNELVSDAQLGVGANIVNYIANLMTVSLNEKEENAFWVGSGSGQPTGIVGHTGRTFAAGAGATDTQRADTLIQAFSNTPQGYRYKSAWAANMGTWGEVARLKDSQNRYLLSDLAGANTQLLKGRPVYESNNLAGGTAIFGDYTYYQIVDREGISVRVSDEATVAGQSAFERNLTYIRVEKRVDAKVTLPAAFTTVTGLGTP